MSLSALGTERERVAVTGSMDSDEDNETHGTLEIVAGGLKRRQRCLAGVGALMASLTKAAKKSGTEKAAGSRYDRCRFCALVLFFLCIALIQV